MPGPPDPGLGEQGFTGSAPVSPTGAARGPPTGRGAGTANGARRRGPPTGRGVGSSRGAPRPRRQQRGPDSGVGPRKCRVRRTSDLGFRDSPRSAPVLPTGAVRRRDRCPRSRGFRGLAAPAATTSRPGCGAASVGSGGLRTGRLPEAGRRPVCSAGRRGRGPRPRESDGTPTRARGSMPSRSA